MITAPRAVTLVVREVVLLEHAEARARRDDDLARVGSISPERQRRNVDLPAPLAPMRP
jgi:hypothetical protein